MPPAEIRHDEAAWTDPRSGHRVFYRCWRPSETRATVMLIHGFAEHSGRYASLAQALGQRQIAVLAPDLRGHGRSDGGRGDVANFEQYVTDLQGLLEQLALPGEAGLALVGHSFGALVAIHWALREAGRFRTLCLQSPLLEIAFPIPGWKREIARRLRPIWPTLRLPSGIDPRWVSRDRAVVEAYRRDPFVHRVISLRAYLAMTEAMRQALAAAPQLTPPTLLVYGEDDHIVSTAACRAFFERLTCQKRLVSYPQAFHELHHEPVRNAVIDELARWITAHG
ncbi:MAG: lysophospholipase [Candidatus Omnitrophica bacterium]|nr:lysophospholipase [Candidatus Omnitrophota bacterium]